MRGDVAQILLHQIVRPRLECAVEACIVRHRTQRAVDTSRISLRIWIRQFEHGLIELDAASTMVCASRAVGSYCDSILATCSAARLLLCPAK